MKNNELIKKYYEAVKALRSLGNEILNNYDDEDDREEVMDALDEIENMTEHCECCLRILKGKEV